MRDYTRELHNLLATDLGRFPAFVCQQFYKPAAGVYHGDGSVKTCAFSPDGGRLVSAGTQDKNEFLSSASAVLSMECHRLGVACRRRVYWGRPVLDLSLPSI